MKRVLCLVSAMNAGGAETFLMKIYRVIDKSQYQMDFCVNVEEECLYDREITAMGGRIYHIPSKSADYRGFSRGLYRIVKENNYKNVLRITSNAMGFYDLYIAKKAGATNCIARSSNSSDGGSLKSKLAHKAGKMLYKRYVDVKIAPSDLAANYTFGKGDYENGKVSLLQNGIDFDVYRYSTQARHQIREELGITEECYLLGHIGRFTKQKNHVFLIDVFAEIHKHFRDTAMLLVGEGELKDAIEEKTRSLGLSDAVRFLGVRKDVPAVFSAIDALVFPSLYEGMPNVVIEAQASGLNCFISDRITKQVVLSDLVRQISVESVSDWVENISETITRHVIRNDREMQRRSEQSLPDEYDINKVAEEFISYLI